MRHLLGISSCSRGFVFEGDEGGGGNEAVELLRWLRIGINWILRAELESNDFPTPS